MLKAINVYLERQKTRKYVGCLSRKGARFVFEYDQNYRLSAHPIAFGPDLDLSKKKHSSLKLFPSFVDRIPMRQNPAYKEYCQSVGISSSETDPMILLSALGRKGPSSFILEPVYKKPHFSGENLRAFRNSLKLSIRDFATLFEISPSAIHRIERGKTSGQRTLKQIEIYATQPQVALAKIQQTGLKINESKKQFAELMIRSKIPTPVMPSLWTVSAKDIELCSPTQLVELLRRLILSECAKWGVNQADVHISENLTSPDGGEDGLVKWTEGPKYTDWFASRYNCFQIKAQKMNPQKCIKELTNSKGQLKPAIKQIIKNKGAYILCSSYAVSGHALTEREEEILSFLKNKGFTNKTQPFKFCFYDGNKLANWTNSYPSVAFWLLKKVCKKPLESAWLSWSEWSREDEDYRSPFMTHTELEQKRKTIYNILSQPRQSLRLIGNSGLGKTRLALEAFRPEFSDIIKKDTPFDLSALVIYTSARDLKTSHVRELKNSRAILIVDDCPSQKAEAFHKIVRKNNSQLSLLTIEQQDSHWESDLGLDNIFKINLEPDKEIAIKILYGKQEIKETDFFNTFNEKILKITQGFPLMARLLREAGPLDLIEKNIPKIKNKMLFGLEPENESALKVIKACALFNNIGFKSPESSDSKIWLKGTLRDESEAKYLAKTICKMDYDEFYKHIMFFKKRGIIQQIGKFIQVRPKPLALWLFKDFLRETPNSSVIQWPKGMNTQWLDEDMNTQSLKGLLHSFCEQLSGLKFSPEAKDIAQQLCKKDGLFSREEILNTQWGASCFFELSKLCPKTALNSLDTIYGSKTVEELTKKHDNSPDFMQTTSDSISIKGFLPDGKNFYLINTLKHLARKKDFYPASARLILKFAESEQINNSKNKMTYSNQWMSRMDIKTSNSHQAIATKLFINHFQIFGSGTEATPEQKFKIIQEIKNSSSLSQKEIAIMALNQALKISFFNNENTKEELFENWQIKPEGPFEDQQSQTKTAFKEWQAQTKEEALNYYRQALKLLTEFAIMVFNYKMKI